MATPGPAKSACKILSAIQSGQMTCEQVMRDCLERIAQVEPQVKAFVDLRADDALADAVEADRLPADSRGPLHGLPVAIKELFDVAGLRCTWGTPIHANRVPDGDSEVVRRLKAAGAIVVGTVVSTEYAIAAAGPTTNPFDHTRTPGGSSSGSAAAVAAGMVPVALGSQTVGSIVRPSLYCGVYGLKPTRGAIPGRGAMALSPMLDHPGPIARSPADLALLCRALFGPCKEDPTSLDIAPPGTSAPIIGGIRVLVAVDMPPGSAEGSTRKALEMAAERLEKAGARVEQFSFPAEYGEVLDVLYTIMCRDMAIAHGADRDASGSLMSPALRDLLDRGRAISQADYDAALKIRERWIADLSAVLQGECVLLAPATDGVAPPAAEGTGWNGPQALWSLVGFPAIAIPTGLADGLPIGVQAAAAPGREDIVLAIAEVAGRVPDSVRPSVVE